MYRINGATKLGEDMTKTLDIGCGTRPRNPFGADEMCGVDVRDDLESNVRKADLVIEPIPYEDESFEYLTAFDFIEHIPRIIYAPTRRNAFVEFMNEVYRVLKPGGLFLSLTPAYPHAPTFRDPTHVNFITDETFPLYFDDTYRYASMYGFTGAFRVLTQMWQGPHLLAVLQKLPAPASTAAIADTNQSDLAAASNITYKTIDYPALDYPYAQFKLYQFIRDSQFPIAAIQQEALKVIQAMTTQKQWLADNRTKLSSGDLEKAEARMKKCLEFIKGDPIFAQVIHLI